MIILKYWFTTQRYCPDVGLYNAIQLTYYSSLHELTTYADSLCFWLLKSSPLHRLKYGYKLAKSLVIHWRWLVPNPSVSILIWKSHHLLNNLLMKRPLVVWGTTLLSKLTRFPYLLPQQNHFTTLIVYYTCMSLSHPGFIHLNSYLPILLDTVGLAVCKETVEKMYNL